MELFTLAVIGAVSILLISFILVLCVNKTCEESHYSEPQLKSIKKNSSQKSSLRRKADTDKEEVVVLTNGAANGYEEVTSNGDDVLLPCNTYEEPEAVKSEVIHLVSQQSNGGHQVPTAVSTVNETSPDVSSQRSSRNSTVRHSRIPSQDRALPEIPNQQSSRQSAYSDKSPSIVRALPQLPDDDYIGSGGGDGGVDEETFNVYDHLEHNLPSHQIKPRTSEKSTNKDRPHLAMVDDKAGVLASSESLIEPDQITRSSVVVSNRSEYSSIPGDMIQESKVVTQVAAAPHQNTTDINNSSVKNKTKVPYTKIKKDHSIDKDSKQPTTNNLRIDESSDNVNTEPIYMEAPPVPEKRFDISVEMGVPNSSSTNTTEMGTANTVLDENAQDSGSGYYSVTSDGPGPNLGSSSHESESYDVLTAREPIETVRARQAAAAMDESHYECLDESGAPRPSANVAYENSQEIYAEIDNQPNYSASTQNQSMPILTTNSSSAIDETYAEICPLQAQQQSNSQLNMIQSTTGFLATPTNVDPGYEKVEFGKGEQMDSAGYSVVTEGRTANTNFVDKADDGDYADYSVVNTSSNADNSSPAVDPNSEMDDYASVTFNGENAGNQTTSNEQQPSPPDSSAAASSNSNIKPQKYKRQPRQHVYQEIDEVVDRKPKSPPDKTS